MKSIKNFDRARNKAGDRGPAAVRLEKVEHQPRQTTLIDAILKVFKASTTTVLTRETISTHWKLARRMASSSSRVVHQDYIARIRYSNTLPPPPNPPKLLDIPNTGLSSGQYTTPGFASRLARDQPLNIEADAELGMPLDLVGMPGIFDGDESCKSVATLGMRKGLPLNQLSKHRYIHQFPTPTTEHFCGLCPLSASQNSRTRVFPSYAVPNTSHLTHQNRASTL